MSFSANFKYQGVKYTVTSDLPQDLIRDLNSLRYHLGTDPYNTHNEERPLVVGKKNGEVLWSKKPAEPSPEEWAALGDAIQELASFTPIPDTHVNGVTVVAPALRTAFSNGKFS